MQVEWARTVDEHQSADPPGVLSRVSHRDRGARETPHQHD